MPVSLDALIGLLDPERIDLNLFRARSQPDTQAAPSRSRLYGGQIMAQAFVAATRTVDAARLPHSLHGYFLRPGDPAIPALIEVERIRDGRSFTTRRVVVVQHGRAIFNMDASFQRVEQGLAHQTGTLTGQPPDPASIPDGLMEDAFIEWRVDHRRLLEERPMAPHKQIWFRASTPAPDDPALHRALLVYESDSALLGTARLPHKGSFARDRMQVASLDHAMYFHADVDVNAWHAYVLDSPSASGARGFTRGSIYREDGVLVASTMQEGLMRVR